MAQPRRQRRPRGTTPRLSAARLEEMIEEATVDAYGEAEQAMGFYSMMEQHLAVPFETSVLDVPVVVERVDVTARDQIVAVCVHGRSRQKVPILELPLPSPLLAGAEWIDAYRRWLGD